VAFQGFEGLAHYIHDDLFGDLDFGSLVGGASVLALDWAVRVYSTISSTVRDVNRFAGAILNSSAGPKGVEGRMQVDRYQSDHGP
jgi:hypothetical protein